MKCALYCRVSTEEQATGGHSIEAQRQELIKYCHAFNYDIIDHYIDAGYSASTMERPALKKLLVDVNEYDIALVWRLDRISRDMSDLMKILEIFSNHNIVFKSKTENFDTSTSSGKLMLNMLGSFAEFERTSISERIKMAHQKILREGKWRGGKPPLGYVLTKDNTLKINEEEAQIIRKIFDLSAYENMGVRAIASQINQIGYFTRNKKPFSSAYITRILKNPTYYGEMVYRRQQSIKKEGKKQVIYKDDFHTYTGLYAPIVSKEVFHISQENMKKRKINRGTSHAVLNVLGGLIYCGDCKAYMLRNSRKNGERFFTCKSYKDYGSCTHHYISENIIMNEIKKAMGYLAVNKKDIAKINIDLIQYKNKKISETLREIEKLEKQTKGYILRENKLFELIEKEMITEAEFMNRRMKLSEERTEMFHLLKEKKHTLKNIKDKQWNEIFIDDSNALDKVFNSLSFQNKKKILKKIIERIEVFDNEKPYGRKKIHIYFKI